MTGPFDLARRVGAAAGVVIREAGRAVGREAGVVVRLGIGTLQDVGESLVFRHARPETTAMPNADI